MAPGNGLGVCCLRRVEDPLYNVELQLVVVKLGTVQFVVPVARLALVCRGSLRRILDQSTHGSLHTGSTNNVASSSTQVHVIHGTAGNPTIELRLRDRSLYVQRCLLHDIVNGSIQDKAVCTFFIIKRGNIVVFV